MTKLTSHAENSSKDAITYTLAFTFYFSYFIGRAENLMSLILISNYKNPNKDPVLPAAMGYFSFSSTAAKKNIDSAKYCI